MRDDEHVDSPTATSVEESSELTHGRMTLALAGVDERELSIWEIDEGCVALADVDKRHANRAFRLLSGDEQSVGAEPKKAASRKNRNALARLRPEEKQRQAARTSGSCSRSGSGSRRVTVSGTKASQIERRMCTATVSAEPAVSALRASLP